MIKRICKTCGDIKFYPPSAAKRPLNYCRKHMPIPNKTHGMYKTRLYKIWESMNRRCYTKSQSAYRYYGGKGITIYPEWRSNFVAFKDWALNNGYSDNLTIERINNDGNYEPKNCTWITQTEQSRHTSRAKLTMELAREIRNQYIPRQITRKMLAEKYNVSVAVIKKIIAGEYWKELGEN